MPCIKYKKHRFEESVLQTINQTNTIINEYTSKGYKLTLRQLYYQMIARDLFPASWCDQKYNATNGLSANTKNTIKNYKRFGEAVSNGRIAGLIDWDAIEDRTRSVSSLSHWDDPANAIYSIAQQFRIDMWQGQPCRVEIWIEKEALSGVFERICQRLDMPMLACRGYTSQSEMWSSAMRLVDFAERHEQKPVILHFGDHDPSGIDMSRDIQERMAMFGCYQLEFKRLALNIDQVKRYNPPPNPAKITDSRFESYNHQYGAESWELDALNPDILRRLVEDAVDDYRDIELWQEREELMKNMKAKLLVTSDMWDEGLEKHIVKKYADEIKGRLRRMD